MFGTLSQGANLYVLDKTGEEPRLKIATINTVSNSNGMNLGWMQPLPGQTVDVTVTFPDGDTSKFERLPANLSVFVYDKAAVTETRELMQQQVETSLGQSKAIIESIPFHEKAVVAYDGILKQLSPAFAKERKTEERLDTLERGLGDIKDLLVKMSVSSSKANTTKA